MAGPTSERKRQQHPLPGGWIVPLPIQTWSTGFHEHALCRYASKLDTQLGDPLYADFRNISYGEGMLPLSSLASLKALQLEFDHEFGNRGLGSVHSLFEKAPNLEILNLSMCLSVPPGLSLQNVTRIHMSTASLGSGQMRNLALACPQLQSLSYRFLRSDEGG